MQAKQIKDEATASTSVNGRPPFNAVKEDLINAIEVVIAQHASLKEAKSAKDEDLQKSLQDDIKEKNQELSDAIDRWVMTRRCEPEEEVRSYKEQEAVDLLCKAIDAERERVNKGGEREKWYDGKDETKMGPLQKAMKNSALVYALPEPFKQYAVPQWKPQSYTRMNPKLEGTCITLLFSVA